MPIILGTPGDDTLFGTADDDDIQGFAGVDSIYGAGGADIMAGGADNDYYVVDNAGDQVIELPGEGYDIVFATANYTLAAGTRVESLGAYDQAAMLALMLTGNEFDNRIVGNAGDNVLNGAGGNDEIWGEGGNDILDGGQGSDDLYGEGGNDALYGLSGLDRLRGGTGDDIYIVDDQSDRVIEKLLEGNDIVLTTVSFSLIYGLNGSLSSDNVESLGAYDQNGTDAINLRANELANRIVGNAGNNILDGMDGGDTLYGLGGADTFTLGTVDQRGDRDQDFIADFTSGEDKIALVWQTFDRLHKPAAGSPEALDPGVFLIGSDWTNGDQRIIYNPVIGSILYDQDGNGRDPSYQIASVPIGTIITASDFLVYLTAPDGGWL